MYFLEIDKIHHGFNIFFYLSLPWNPYSASLFLNKLLKYKTDKHVLWYVLHVIGEWETEC